MQTVNEKIREMVEEISQIPDIAPKNPTEEERDLIFKRMNKIRKLGHFVYMVVRQKETVSFEGQLYKITDDVI
jgi:hypothetical protein